MTQRIQKMEAMHTLLQNHTADDIVERAKQLGLETHPTDALEIDLEDMIYRDVILGEELDYFTSYKFCKKYKGWNPVTIAQYRDLFEQQYIKYQQQN